MNRSKWKGPTFNKNSFNNFQTKNIKIARNVIILPKFIGKTFKVYNGKQFSEISITKKMLFYKFGEFLPTKKPFSFKKKKKNN